MLEAVNYYSSEGKDSAIQKIVMNNEIEFDTQKLLAILDNKDKFYIQLYFFSKGLIFEDFDFYTPFLRLFSALKAKVGTGKE